MGLTKKILVTGGAGFIGSNLIEQLLRSNYKVICLDNLSTGSLDNVKEFEEDPNFEFVAGDILDFDLLLTLSKDVFAISHQAALGSVPRSIKDPITSNRVNIEGTLNVFKAAVDAKVERVVYAASSSTYGDSQALPKVEGNIGKPLSPYAITKAVNEMYADVFHQVYGLNTIGLRYFNVFGPKQNPSGPYAAVIPLFIEAIISGKEPCINGDGNHSRDFTFVQNAVQANIRSIEAPLKVYNSVYNVAYGEQTTLNELVAYINEIAGIKVNPTYGPERVGDVRHSLADISKARKDLGYSPDFNVNEGLRETIHWFYQSNRQKLESRSK